MEITVDSQPRKSKIVCIKRKYESVFREGKGEGGRVWRGYGEHEGIESVRVLRVCGYGECEGIVRERVWRGYGIRTSPLIVESVFEKPTEGMGEPPGQYMLQ